VELCMLTVSSLNRRKNNRHSSSHVFNMSSSLSSSPLILLTRLHVVWQKTSGIKHWNSYAKLAVVHAFRCWRSSQPKESPSRCFHSTVNWLLPTRSKGETSSVYKDRLWPPYECFDLKSFLIIISLSVTLSFYPIMHVKLSNDQFSCWSILS